MSFRIIAHRGESYDAPENTLSAISLAWERGAEAVEVDVHLSSDNRVVVIHDPNTKRISGIDRKIKKQTINELKLLDAGAWKDLKYMGERIPTLLEVIKTVPYKKTLIIEIKSGKKLVPFLKEEIEKSGIEKYQIEIISFNYSALKLAKTILPDVTMLYLTELDYSWLSKALSPSVDELIKRAKIAYLNGLNVWAGKTLNKNFIQKVKGAGLLLYVWTVNDPEIAKKLVSWGIDGITTDRAEWMTKKLQGAT